MRLFNGMAEFYRIEARNRCWKKKDWYGCVGDHFGHPKGFMASDPVWQNMESLALKILMSLGKR
jgi:hypothetical protein